MIWWLNYFASLFTPFQRLCIRPGKVCGLFLTQANIYSFVLYVKVVAPILETLASLLIHSMPRRSLLHVRLVLLQMITVNFVVPVDNKTKSDVERPHVWEFDMRGLL
jgi:hypothetical protein